jgi:hypothetical protein
VSIGSKKDLHACVCQQMKLTARAAAANSTKHRGIERLTDNQERELGRRNSRILNHQFPSLDQP